MSLKDLLAIVPHQSAPERAFGFDEGQCHVHSSTEDSDTGGDRLLGGDRRARRRLFPAVAAPAPEIVDSWYLRGFVGIGMNGTPTLDYLPAPANVGNGFAFDQHSIADTTFIGAGVGYDWNSWLRFDLSGEYRAKTQVNARGVYDQVTGQGDAYQGYLKSWVILANGFVDLGTWNCFTPFVGVGIGGAYNQLADFVDMGIGQTGAGFGRNTAEWHMAYALYAGIGYAVSKNLKVDLSYRYLNYGIDHRHRRLHRRLQPGLLQVRQSLFARHHARAALDLLRNGTAATLCLYPAAGLYAAAAAAEQPGLVTRASQRAARLTAR